jgi:hypothetical protein
MKKIQTLMDGLKKKSDERLKAVNMRFCSLQLCIKVKNDVCPETCFYGNFLQIPWFNLELEDEDELHTGRWKPFFFFKI